MRMRRKLFQTRVVIHARLGTGEVSDEQLTIAGDVMVTKYKMAGDISNREFVNSF